MGSSSPRGRLLLNQKNSAVRGRGFIRGWERISVLAPPTWWLLEGGLLEGGLTVLEGGVLGGGAIRRGTY